MKEQRSKMVFEVSSLRMASIFFFQGLIPSGPNQQLSQSVSWMAHSHFRGLTVNAANLLHVSIMIIIEDSNVINKNVDFVQHVFENVFHDLLSEVRTVANAHRKSVTTAFAKWSNNNAEPGAFFIKFEGAELHRDVNLCHVLVFLSFAEDVLDARDATLLAHKHGV